MTLEIVLEDEFGEREDGFVDAGYLIAAIEPSMSENEDRRRLLDYIDPWGNTMFNRLQLDRLSAELEELEKIKPSEKLTEVIAQLQNLIVKCKATSHHYIKITGD